MNLTQPQSDTVTNLSCKAVKPNAVLRVKLEAEQQEKPVDFTLTSHTQGPERLLAPTELLDCSQLKAVAVFRSEPCDLRQKLWEPREEGVKRREHTFWSGRFKSLPALLSIRPRASSRATPCLTLHTC